MLSRFRVSFLLRVGMTNDLRRGASRAARLRARARRGPPFYDNFCRELPGFCAIAIEKILRKSGDIYPSTLTRARFGSGRLQASFHHPERDPAADQPLQRGRSAPVEADLPQPRGAVGAAADQATPVGREAGRDDAAAVLLERGQRL